MAFCTLGIGVTVAIFHLSGNIPDVIILLDSNVNSRDVRVKKSFKTLLLILSISDDLYIEICFTRSNTSFWVIGYSGHSDIVARGVWPMVATISEMHCSSFPCHSAKNMAYVPVFYHSSAIPYNINQLFI